MANAISPNSDLKPKIHRADRFVPRIPESHALKIGLIAVTLAGLSYVHVLGGDLFWRTENALLVVFTTVIGAWCCRLWPVFTMTLVTDLVWCYTDTRQDSVLWISLVTHAGRIALTLLLVVWTSIVRQSRDEARHFARIDGLTGLSNRQAILEALDAELGRLRRFGRSFSIVMIDCDGFKAINDIQGHLVGDHVLQSISTALRKQIRTYDCIGRLGGDEFVLILSEASIDEVSMIVERLRTALSVELIVEHPSLTFSIGVVTVQATTNADSTSLDCFGCLQKVDEAMYAAKRSGRDQIRFETLIGRL